MSLAELVAEYDEETGRTRKILERLPDDRLDWQPHVKSMTLGRLATHLADLHHRAADVLGNDDFDVMPDGTPRKPRILGSRAEIVALLEENDRIVRPLIEAATAADLAAPWTLRRHGQVMFAMTRGAALRRLFFSHGIHHRGQLTVYLRLNDVPLPALFGPSADEAM